MTILIFLLVLFVLILVHELGHFVAAKISKMRVDEFGIGFPPRLFSVQNGETRYSINALPIGGFVKIFGENGEADESRAESSERSFSSRPRIQQAFVLVAGVVMNVLLAWVLIAVVFMIGVERPVDASEASADATLMVAEVLSESPAARADIPRGARIVSVGSLKSTDTDLTPERFSTVIANASGAVTITYKTRDGEVRTATLEPETGVLDTEPERELIGISTVLTERVSYSAVAAFQEATIITTDALVAITVGITTLLIDALSFSADLEGVAGPVGIVGMVGDAASDGVVSLLMFTAVISLNLAVINLLPFPALDGGRLVIVGIESVIRRPVNPVWVARVNAFGFVLLILLMIAVTYNDILRIL